MHRDKLIPLTNSFEQKWLKKGLFPEYMLCRKSIIVRHSYDILSKARVIHSYSCTNLIQDELKQIGKM